jgi:hypothetical protein
MDLPSAAWRKSTRSGSTGNCVEVADNVPGVVAMRDSKDPAAPALTFTPGEWSTFVDGVEEGEFDF